VKDKFKSSNDRLAFEDNRAPLASDVRPLSGILQEVLAQLTEIIRSEVRLARVEIREDMKQVARAGLFVVVSAVLALYAFGFILLAGVHALARTAPLWASALVVGIGLGLIAIVFLLVGRKKMKMTSLRPDETIETLQENVTWLKKHAK
jgi:uncharacterized membrane protein YqjE